MTLNQRVKFIILLFGAIFKYYPYSNSSNDKDMSLGIGSVNQTPGQHGLGKVIIVRGLFNLPISPTLFPENSVP